MHQAESVAVGEQVLAAALDRLLRGSRAEQRPGAATLNRPDTGIELPSNVPISASGQLPKPRRAVLPVMVPSAIRENSASVTLCSMTFSASRYPAWRVAGFERHVRQSVRHLAFGPNHEAIATRRGDRSPGGIGNRSSVELSHEIGQANVDRQEISDILRQ